MRISVMAAALLLATPMLAGPALAQAPQQPFAPFTVDAQKYEQIDAVVAKWNLSRDAHTAWITLWQGLERQAQQDKAVADARAEAEKKVPPKSPLPPAGSP